MQSPAYRKLQSHERTSELNRFQPTSYDGIEDMINMCSVIVRYGRWAPNSDSRGQARPSRPNNAPESLYSS